MHNDLVEQFLEYCRPILDDPATPTHSLRIGDNRSFAILTFPTEKPDGFDVVVTVVRAHISVSAGVKARVHMDNGKSARDTVEAALGLIRDLLSPDMRVRQQYAGRQLYWAGIERFDGSEWKITSSTGLMFWNYFGKRSEKIFVNRQMPGRLSIEHVT
jgi:hypothetical protein